MPDQVTRYETEQQYIDFKNQRANLTGGKVEYLPSFGDNPDAYWRAHHDYMRDHPEAVLRTLTVLLWEEIEMGALVRQHVEYKTISFESLERSRLNDTFISDHMDPDPGVPVSAKFKTRQEAENMRHLLLQGEPGYYYGIRHYTRVGIWEKT
jgi:hypothetical protein